MIPNGPGQKNNYVEFITLLRQLVAEGKVPQSRIDDAARRILRVKYELGLFEHPYADPKLTEAVGSAEHRKVARECVRQSLVVLKNADRALPLSKKLKHLVVVGKAADDLGMQCGGWTISWQGQTGEVMRGGTTILAAVRQAVSPGTKVTFSPDGSNMQGRGRGPGGRRRAALRGDEGRPQRTCGLSAADVNLVATGEADRRARRHRPAFRPALGPRRGAGRQPGVCGRVAARAPKGKALRTCCSATTSQPANCLAPGRAPMLKWRMRREKPAQESRSFLTALASRIRTAGAGGWLDWPGRGSDRERRPGGRASSRAQTLLECWGIRAREDARPPEVCF